MYGATAAAAHQNLVLEAVKAVGTVVTVDPAAFGEILARSDAPLVVWALGGVFGKRYTYLTPYRGLAFTCQSKTPLDLPMDAELVEAKRIALPEL